MMKNLLEIYVQDLVDHDVLNEEQATLIEELSKIGQTEKTKPQCKKCFKEKCICGRRV
jgi:hypothetical protein